MKKTVVFEFSDGFEFPPEFDDRACRRLGGMYEPDIFCPFYAPGDEYEPPCCVLTGGEEGYNKACPFYNGADTVNFVNFRS